MTCDYLNHTLHSGYMRLHRKSATSEKKKSELQSETPPKKPRIRIPNPKGILGKLTNKLRGKCNSKKGCNKNCGCCRKGQNCTIAGACRSACTKNPKSYEQRTDGKDRLSQAVTNGSPTSNFHKRNDLHLNDLVIKSISIKN